MKHPVLLPAMFAQMAVPAKVAVALFGLEASKSTVLAALSDLGDEERRRAAHFAFDRDRRRFAMSHLALRRLLSDACGVHASELRFATEPLGRPYLQAPSNLDFNMSHSGDAAAYAVSSACRVGIDIEMIVPAAIAELADRVLAPVEFDALQRMPIGARSTAFFRWWTAKEAFLKLHGLGLAMEPQTIVVNLDTGIASCGTPGLPAAHIAWLPAGERAVCALATPGVVHRHDVSDWLARVISAPCQDIDDSSRRASFREQFNPRYVSTKP